jgi:hypothetical protein
MEWKSPTSLIDDDKVSAEWAEHHKFPTRVITHNAQPRPEQTVIVEQPADDRTRDWLASQEYPTKNITYVSGLRPRMTEKQFGWRVYDLLPARRSVSQVRAA